jgi:lipopolysaccharide/colanic/teichoic acid biosynthesis glycosyltransferase
VPQGSWGLLAEGLGAPAAPDTQGAPPATPPSPPDDTGRPHLSLVRDDVGTQVGSVPAEEEGDLRYWSRRVLNMAVALVGILLTAPLMLAIALLVKLSSPGPVLFTQPRVGLDRRWRPGNEGPDPRRKNDMGGRIFRIYKFRTMTHCDTRAQEQTWATPDDPRVTRLGRFLRNTRMDELPQFFNVLKGDMNIVGPRPEQPEIFQRLREEVDGYQHRQRVLPGITGLAQVNHHYDRSIKDVEIKVRHDLEYVGRVSTIEDLRIMARTLPVVLFRKGAW